jgi:hypothetical protein
MEKNTRLIWQLITQPPLHTTEQQCETSPGSCKAKNPLAATMVRMWMYTNGGTDVPMHEVKLVFSPSDASATLIDGSAVTPFERTVENIAGTFMVKDVTIGKYQVKEVYSGKTRLLKNRHLDEQPEVSKPVVFSKNGYLGETEYNIEFWLSE